jgi:putative ABC transport system permease protein
MIFKLAWRNLWRNKSRTGITIASVFFAVVLSVVITSIQRGAMQNLVKGIVGFYSSYIQVHKKGYFDEQTLDNAMDVSDTLIARIKQQENVTIASPRLETFVLASNGENTQGCQVVGILPSQEAGIIQLSKKVTEGTYMGDKDTGIMVAQGLANKLNLKLNDTLILLGQGYQGVTAANKYPVKTILHFGSPQLNDHLLFMPLWQSQQFLTADNKATSIVIAVADENLVDNIQKNIAKNIPSGYEVINWQQMIPDIVQLVKSKRAGEYVVTMLLYMLVSFGMFATLLMMMNERKFEIGMLMAIGTKKGQLARMILLENVFVSLVGVGLGLAASIPVTYLLRIHPISFTGSLKKMYENMGFEATVPASMDPSIFYRQVIIIAVVSLLLGFYPLLRIYRMNALNAMKK